ncbi:MAG: response regulator [Steroidobacteraceae bacterium]
MSDEPGTLARILVVDDSRLILRAAQKMLSAEFEVITAGDGVDAWEVLVGDTTIHVVFTDLNMPNCTGFELLQKIRTSAEPGLQNLPVIVMTGASDDEAARLQSLQLGATDFITKPFSSIDLIARARAHAKYQRATRQLQAHSTLDPLTGLANKPGFLDRLQQDIAYARRHQQDLTVVRVEIDDLRAIFLKRGKGPAEQLVMHVASLIRAHIRKEDTAARIGLGGFAISLPGGQVQGIESMVDRLSAEVAAHPPLIERERLSLVLRAAALGAELQQWPSAEEMLDRCEALLQNPNVRRAMASAPALRPHESPAAPVAPAPRAIPLAAPRPEPLRLDPLLDQVKQGHTQEAIDKMPQVMQRLLPLLRLLTASQRTQFIRFMERMGDQ